MNTRTVAAGRRITDLLDGVVSNDPTAGAAMDGDRRMTYRELREARDQYAKALLALGVGRGDRVAMATPPCLDFWIVLHAATSIGAIWVGINPRYQSRDFAQLLADATPAVLIAVSPFEGRDYVAEIAPLLPAGTPVVAIGAATAPAITTADFLSLGAAVSDAALKARQDAVDPGDAAIIVYTSGTTGRPKGAMLSHRAIVASALANAAWMKPEDLAAVMCVSPVNHVGAINNVCMNVLAGGGRIIFFPRIDTAAMAAIGAREKPSYMVSSPTGFAMMLAGGGAMKRLSTVRLLVFGGAMTALSVLEQIAPFGARLSCVYGQTETCGIITRTADTDPLEAHANTIGTVLPGAELRIAGPDGTTAAAAGEAGEIQIRGPYVMSGYFNNPTATAEAFTADGFLRTGDIGRVREDGNVVFVGRLKEMFKSGGYNIYPVEIEQAICEHPAVALAAVVSVDDPKFQEVGYAFVQPEPGAVVTAEDLRLFLRGRIANYKVPKVFEVREALPLLPNGKLHKVSLQKLAAG